MIKEPFTIQMDRLVLVMGRDVVADLGAQIHAHDPSLPADLEGQLRELFARPTESDASRATVAAMAPAGDPVEIGNPFEPPPPPPTKAVEGDS